MTQSSTSTPAYLSELNPAQRAAATAGDGPILVIAGAGTGKTKTLAARVAYLLGRGVPADRILLLTFTRRAAQEMLTRASRITGANATARVWGGTFHATANRLLRQHARAVGLAPEFSVIDQTDGADLMHLIRTDLGFGKGADGKKRRFPQKTTLMAIYSYMVNARMKLSAVLETHYPWCADDQEAIKQIIEQYMRRKRTQNVLDYDDLLLYWKALLGHAVAGPAIADQFEHVLVDEYQDTNLIQSEILQAMRKSKKSIMVVGDDAQSIYSFRAATVRNILDFPKLFRAADGAEAATITLEQNYRSRQPILDASNAVMGHAKERYTKNLFSDRGGADRPAIVTCMDEAEQTEEVCKRIVEKLEQHIPLKKQAVLFRAGHHSDALEVELTRRNIPFVKYGGLKFIEAAHIKDMLAMLRILENPADEIAWFRVLQLLTGIGPASADRILQSMGLRAAAAAAANAAAAGAPGGNPGPTDVTAEAPSDLPAPLPSKLETGNAKLAAALPAMLARATAIPPAGAADFTSMRTAITDVAKDLPPATTIERLRRFYEPIFKRIYDNPNVRLRDLDQLEQIATTYKSRTAFVTDLTLDPPNSTQDLAGPPLLEEDWITLSTIHSAKGMEWDCVHILHVADGMIPSDMATGSEEEIDEERRLLYVAMTRAKDALTLYFPLRYYHHRGTFSDRHSYAQLTRFVAEGDYPHFDRVAAPRVKESEEKPAAGDGKGGIVSVDGMISDLLG